MGRLRAVGFCAGVALALSVGVSSASAAGIMDWTVNGVPLAAGKKAPVTLQSTGPVVLSYYAENESMQIIKALCSSFVAKGTLIGGEEGGAKLKPKLTGCEGPEGGAVKVTMVVIETTFDGELLHPTTWTHKLRIEIGVIKIEHGNQKERLSGGGIIDAEGPFGGQVTFPETPLPASTLEIGGQPASIEMVDTYTLKKGGTLGVGALSATELSRAVRYGRW